jgi:peptide/nickel transport system permease protein
MSTLRRALIAFALLHLGIALGGFLAPYLPTAQNRDFPYVPPQGIHFFDAQGRFHLRPFVYGLTPASDGSGYSQDREAIHPVRFFVSGSEYRIMGLLPARMHLFGTVQQPWFLLGTDAFGRDQLSRILYGGQLSLAAAAVATLLSLGLGFLLGSAAGYYGGGIDDVVMRVAELGLVLPWIYLLLGIRAYLPLQVSAIETFFLLTGLLGILGWTRPARIIRGVVLSARERSCVLAARGFGASDFYLLRRHILPQVAGVMLTQAVLLIPTFIAAEVTLSFLGLGIGEPAPSWGAMLAGLQQYEVLTSYWWIAAPVLALVLVSLAYFRLASALRSRIKSVAI